MKRKFSIFVAAACLFSSLSFGSLAHAATAFTDVTNTTPNSEAILTLTKLGVINGYANDDKTTYSFKPNGDITRGEFAKIITVALGAENDAATSSIKFSDIDDHWAKPYVLIAASRGIVNGFEDGTFKPDENVTYEQAVKMIVCAAGYETIAQSLGGWPNGYMMQAINLKLTNDAATSDQTGKASRGIVAQLMYNVLDVDIPVYNTITGKLEDDLETFMEKYLGIVMADAQLVGVEEKTVANYTGPALYVGEMAIKLKNGSIIVVDYTPYTQDKASLEAYVGQDAVVYYKEGKSGNLSTLHEIDFAVAKNTVMTVGSTDIESFSGNSIRYHEKGASKTKTIKLASSDVSVYYNGKLAEDASKISQWLDPTDSEFIYGEVKLTDRRSDGEFDTVEITDYKIIVASRTPSTEDYNLISKIKFNVGEVPATHLASVTLDPESFSYTVNVIDENGKKVEPTTIVANDVLLVAQSEDESIRTVVICPAPVTGKITSSLASEGIITINGKEYTISDYAQQYFKNNNISTETGSKGTFYADKNNTIIFATQSAVSESTNPYAYIIKTTYNEDEETGKLTAYVPSQSGVKTFNLAGKVKYNGSSMSVEDAINKLRANATSAVANPDAYDEDVKDDIYAGSNPDSTGVSQVARILVEGTDVKEIEVAQADVEFGSTQDKSKIKPFLELEKVTYSGSNNFSGKFNVNSSTVFIYVPQDRSNTSSYEKRQISSFYSGLKYYVQQYNANDSKTADLVVVYGSATATVHVKNNTEAFLMANNSKEVDGDDVVYKIEYFKNSSTISKAKASVQENVNSSNSQAGYDIIDIGEIKVGDFFRAGTDSSLGLVNAQMLIKYDDVKAEINQAASGDNLNSDFTDKSKFYKEFEDGKYGELFVANIVEILDDNGTYTIVTSQDGFDENGEHKIKGEERHISLNKSIVIYKIDDDGKVVPCGDDWSPAELRGSKDSGTAANKICVYSFSTTPSNRPVKMILIY